MADQPGVLPPVCHMDLPRDVQELHDHHAEVKVNRAHDAVALRIVVAIPVCQPQVLDSHHAVPGVHLVRHPGQEPRQGIGLRDGEHLGKRHDQADRQVDEVIDPGAASLVAGHGVTPLTRDRPGRFCKQRSPPGADQSYILPRALRSSGRSARMAVGTLFDAGELVRTPQGQDPLSGGFGLRRAGPLRDAGRFCGNGPHRRRCVGPPEEAYKTEEKKCDCYKQ